MVPTQRTGAAPSILLSSLCSRSRWSLPPPSPCASQPTALRFEVRLGHRRPRMPAGRQSPDTQPRSGRLLVVLGKPGREPRLAVGQTGKDAPPVLGRDVVNFAAAPWRCSTTTRRSSRSTA